jgi:hypothetical protein
VTISPALATSRWAGFYSKVYGDCVPSVTTPVFHRFVGEVMSEKVYKRPYSVFWILDNGTCHRTDKQIMELERLYPNIIVANLPGHASWLNEDETYLSVLAPKVLTLNGFGSVDDLIQKIIRFQDLYSQTAKPFN